MTGYAAQEIPAPSTGATETRVKRKPVPAPARADVLSKEVLVADAKPEYDRQDTIYTIDILPPRSNARSRAPILSASFYSRWTLFSKRTRIFILTTSALFLVLIIGLAAGLALRKSRITNLPLPNSHGGPYSGDLTYYDPALGACGLTNSGSDSICAVSHILFDAVSTSSNPNVNPLCGKRVRIRREGKSIDLTVVDRCTGCKPTDIDTTRSVFTDLANIDDGRVDVEWSWLEDVPAQATGG